MSEGDVGIRLDLRASQPGFELRLNLSLPGKGVSVLLGPSGCGKTTVLRTLAGLSPAQGLIEVNGQTWQDDSQRPMVRLPTHLRPIGYVFQEASLFAHLDVQGNLRYGQERRPLARRRLAQQDVVDVLGIGAVMRRRPQQLSGGERQRVAIARALLTSPELLLMDEPLSALDHERRQDILPYLERLNAHWGIPMLYVTHAMDEALRLADHLVLMDQGSVRAHGPASELFSDLNLPLSARDDAAAVLEAKVREHDGPYGQSCLDVDGQALWVGLVNVPIGGLVRVRIMARDVSIARRPASDSSIANSLAAHIAEVHAEALTVTMKLHLLGPTQGGRERCILSRVTRRSWDHLGFKVGERVYAQIKGVALMA